MRYRREENSLFHINNFYFPVSSPLPSLPDTTVLPSRRSHEVCRVLCPCPPHLRCERVPHCTSVSNRSSIVGIEPVILTLADL